MKPATKLLQLFTMRTVLRTATVLLAATTASIATSEVALAEANKAAITVLYDAFGKSSNMTKDWGFSAYIEYGGKRIVFDSGNNADIFEHNAKAKGVDFTKLDFAVISHRHSDHATGVSRLIAANPNLRIYTPKENFGLFGAALPGTFLKGEPSLPAEMRYFDGKPPAKLRFGTPWPKGNFVWVDKTTEIMPGFHLLLLKGNWGVDLPVMELSLAIDTPDGIVLVVGCSHPTIEKVVAAAKAALNKPIHFVIGGLHLLPAKRDEIARIANELHDKWKVEYIAPVHCTGEAAFKILKERFADHYVYAGLGTTVLLGPQITQRAEAGQPVQYAMDEEDLRSYRAAAATEPMRALEGKGWSRLARAAAR